VIRGPITEAQEGLWLARRLDPASPAQNTAQALRLRGQIDPERLVALIDATLEECDGLRVCFRPGPAGGEFDAREVPPIRTEVVDLRSLASGLAGAAETVARARISDDLASPRDPEFGPMATSVLYRLGDDAHLWYLCVQHLVIDGYGSAILVERVLDRIEAESTGGAERTRPFASFSEVVADDRAQRESDRTGVRSFWRAMLEGVDAIPSLSEGEPIAGPRCHLLRAPMPSELLGELDELARAAGPSWVDVVIATAALYTSRHAGATDVVLGIPVMNRMGSASACVPCMRMNLLPLRLDVDEALPVIEWVSRVATAHRNARRNARVRGEDLRRELGRIGDGRRLYGPVVNVLPFPPLRSPSCLDAEFEVLAAGPVDDITFTVRRRGFEESFDLEVEANPALYSEGEAAEHRDRFLGMLTAVAASPDGTLGVLPTITPAEHQRFVHEVNATDHPVPDTTLVAMIAETLIRHPQRPALVGDGARWSRAELAGRVAEAAARLAAEGVRQGDLVAVLLPRSPQQIVTFLAAMWRGAAYLPLDPEHPDSRIAAMLDDASPRVVVTDGAGAPRLQGRSVLVLDGADAPIDPGAHAAPAPVVPTDPAYVLYTSGSTGLPNGVVIQHRAIVNRLAWMAAGFDVGADDVVLHKTPATFDVSVWEIFLPLLTGATLVVAPEGAQRDPGRLARLVRAHGVTAMHFVPSLLGPFLDHPESAGIEIARVFCSGEALTPALRDRFHTRVTGELHNLYGPTEAAIDVTHWPAPPEDRSDPLPIGRPVWNTRTYILDAELRPVPPGVTGELWLAGRQLARGYLAREALTAERFRPDPFHQGQRMYRTGDLARWGRDGEVLYIGRIDSQVKVRGQRVELGEVESALAEIPGVGAAVAGVRAGGSGAPALTAWIVPAANGEALKLEEVRTALGGRLPAAMVPTAWVMLDALPLTSSGKVDRRALPDPVSASPSSERPPATKAEELVARLYQEVLGLGAMPGRDDEFFALGGDSIRAVELLNSLRDDRGIDLGPGAIFGHPSVTGFGAIVERALDFASGAQAFDGFDTLLSLGEGTSPERPTVWCVHPAGGLAWSYRSLARSLGGVVDLVGVQAAALDPEVAEPESIDAMAASYVDAILKREGEGPIHLLGWSVGGIIAHAMACRLEQRGRAPGMVVMLDAYPADCWRDEADPAPGAALKALLLIAGVPPQTIHATRPTRAAVRAALRTHGHVLGTLSDAALEGVIRVVTSNNRLVRRHHHGYLDGEILHFEAALDHEEDDMDAALWAPYAARVSAHRIPTVHGRMTGEEASARIASVLAERLAGVAVS